MPEGGSVRGFVGSLGGPDEIQGGKGGIRGAGWLDRAATTEFHLLHFGGNDDAVVVSAEVGHVANLFKGVLPEDKGAGFHSLESRKDDQGIFSIIGCGCGLSIDSDISKLFDNFPVLSTHDINIRFHRFGSENGEEAF